MSEVILAVVEQPEAAARTLAAASRLADITRARRVIVLASRIPPIATIMPTEEVLSRKDEVRIRAEEQARTAALKLVYDGWMAKVQSGEVATEWCDVEGRSGQGRCGLGQSSSGYQLP